MLMAGRRKGRRRTTVSGLPGVEGTFHMQVQRIQRGWQDLRDQLGTAHSRGQIGRWYQL